ncbi:MAG: DUF1592 domain-containing protein [bacterium]|nr:DUF1592 domain-containing protein [bacterium]
MSLKSNARDSAKYVAMSVTICFWLLTEHLTRADENQTTGNDATGVAAASIVEEYKRVVLPILQDYCFDCHAEGANEGDLALDNFTSFHAMTTDAQTWWAVLKNVRSDVMPPHGEKQPSDAEKRLLFEWITGHVFPTHRLSADPGPGKLRRLNRLEYRNTIRDLMGVDFDTSIEFPPDDSGDGFDNNADALSISPLLAEKYVAAAQEIVDRAVPKTSRVIPVQLIDAGQFQTDIDSKSTRLLFNTAATASTEFQIAGDVEYRVVVPIDVDGSFDFNSARARVQLFLDEQVLHDQEYGWRSDFVFEVSHECRLSQGKHSLKFKIDPIESKDGQGRSPDEDGTFVRLQIPTVRIEGPLDPAQWKRPDGYDRFFHLSDTPTDATARRQYAAEVLRRFCLRAYRRPVDETHLNRLLDMAGLSSPANAAEPSGPSKTLTFEQRIGRAMTAVLASTRFLFRIEQPRADSADEFPEVDDFSLASRLSYFLWSTMPDETLLQLAEQGNLKANLSEQVERMLRDERSDRLIENFVGQWLQTRDVESVSIDPLAALGVREEYERLSDYLESTASGRRRPPADDASPEQHAAYNRYQEIRGLRNLVDGDLRRDMAQETQQLFAYVLRNDRSLLELIDSDYAFLNQRLAKHYGVPGIAGDEIHQVQLPPQSPLGGVLTQGTFLMVTSNPTRTSPVKRGLFILDNILGTPAPPPPAAVPELEDSAEQSKFENPTLRQLLEIHRSEPLCRSCHARFDPLGLAFENFTAIGTWRETDHGQAIQPGGQLISGESFENVTDLKQVLTGSRRLDFYRCLSERMLSYAIGRSLDFGDEVTLERITHDLEEHRGSARSLIFGVVESVPFRRMRRTEN